MKFPNLSPTHSSLAKCRQSLLAELGFARRQLITQIKTINPTWLNIQPCRSKNEYYTVVETPEFNICLFVLQRGQVIPLHDHPDMTVFGKIVAGEMEVKTYSQIDPRTR